MNNEPIKNALIAERKKLIDEITYIDSQTTKIYGEPRRQLLRRKTVVLQSIRETTAKIKELNRSVSNDAFAAIGIALDGLHLLRDMYLHQQDLVADCKKRLEIMHEMTKVKIPEPAIPNDFETWRRECYDRNPS